MKTTTLAPKTEADVWLHILHPDGEPSPDLALPCEGLHDPHVAQHLGEMRDEKALLLARLDLDRPDGAAAPHRHDEEKGHHHEPGEGHQGIDDEQDPEHADEGEQLGDERREPRDQCVLDPGHAIDWSIFYPKTPTKETMSLLIDTKGTARVFNLPESPIPDDIKYVVVSHLHLDHGGNVGKFPNSTIVVQKTEVQNAFWPEPGTSCCYIVADVMPLRAPPGDVTNAVKMLQAAGATVVEDPFAGSGTTGEAVMKRIRVCAPLTGAQARLKERV